MKRKILNILVIILTISTIFELYVYIDNSKKSQVLEDIKINETFKNKKDMISIQIQNDNDYGFHESTDRTKWPDKNIYTFGGAECTDGDGEVVNYKDVLSFDETSSNYTIHIKTKNTIYCTLYFSKGKQVLDYLKAKGGSKFNSTSAVFGLYRFNGTTTDVTNHNLNNFVCFGTTDLATCTGSDKQYYMYRIIGITDGSTTNTTLGLEANQLKIIRAYPSSTSQAWKNGYGMEAKWEESDMITYLNGTFIANDKIKWINEDFWDKMIISPYWYIGDNESYATSEDNITAKTSSQYQIGLMYQSDFYNAYGTNTSNWLFVANGMNGNPTLVEWTMSKWGTPATKSPLAIGTNGTISYGLEGAKNVARPVFYLKSNVTLASEGTESSPFIITNKS